MSGSDPPARDGPEVAVVGGSLGGVAAALAAADAGAETRLLAPHEWVGGQLTTQGVACPDEHERVETFGPSRRYAALRERVRERYRERGWPDEMPDGGPLNPGNGWVSRLCFEPRVGAEVLDEALARRERLTVRRGVEAVAATVERERVTGVRFDDGSEVDAAYVLDATERGDLLPLTETPFVTGAEPRADTGEAGAPLDARPRETQAFTWCFAVEHVPGEDYSGEPPPGYAQFRERQPYTFAYENRTGEVDQYRMFAEGPDGELPFWTYRRLVDADLGDRERDVALINWSGNDYHDESLVGLGPEERAAVLRDAELLARGFLHWLRTDAPRDDGDGTGYPGLRLCPEVMGTDDGFAVEPYYRESRRIRARTRVTVPDVAADQTPGARARPVPDTVGVGHYPIDVHGCAGNPDVALFEATSPFRVPMGALLPRGRPNLLAACKNIGVTHLTNGCYRLHPVEWSVGEAAGALAAACAGTGVDPPAVHADPRRRRRFQRALLEAGVPIAWTTDVPPAHDLFVPTQLLVAEGAVPPDTPRGRRLDVRPDEPLTAAERRGGLTAARRIADATASGTLDGTGLDSSDGEPTWRDLCAAVEPALPAADW
jgi:hypothetical protein